MVLCVCSVSLFSLYVVLRWTGSAFPGRFPAAGTGAVTLSSSAVMVTGTVPTVGTNLTVLHVRKTSSPVPEMERVTLDQIVATTRTVAQTVRMKRIASSASLGTSTAR